MSWKKVKLGDIFNIEKGILQSSKCTPGNFTFITAAENWKTHNTYSHDCEALIFAAAASGSLGRTHYINGKFISSDLCFILTQKDKKRYPLDLRFYHFVFNSLREIIVKATKTGTSKEAVNYTNFYNYELPYFEIEQQYLWIDKLIKVESIKDKLLFELDRQQSYLQLLRQTILQEAVQGKLTKQDPTDEPASELLKRLRVEKQKLIKAGKLKKEKVLPPITEDEIPYELPAGWVWCRLKELGFITGGGTPSTNKSEYWNGNIPWITPKDMKADYLNDSQDKVTIEGVNNSSAKLIPANSVLVVGRSGILKRLLPVCINNFECTVNQDLKVLVPHLSEMARYIQLMLQGHQEFILKDLVKYGMTVHSLMYQEFEMQVFPLPPFAEQQRIVAKVQQLQKQLSQLETQVQQSWEYAQQLLQSVLREAFEEKGKVYKMEEEITMVAEGDV